MRYWMVVCIVLFLCSAVTGSAQVDSADVADSVRSLTLAQEAGGEEETGDDGYRMTKSPGLALLWGIIPGGGQLYTEQYWKIPLFAIPIGTLAGVGFHNHSLFNDYANQVRLFDPDSPEYARAKILREQYRDRRDLSFAIAGGVFLLSLIDAYSGAHLFDFDVGDDLSSLYLFPDIQHSGVGVGVRW